MLSFEPHKPDPVCTCGHGMSLHLPLPGQNDPARGRCSACAELALAGQPFPRRACQRFEEQ
jgi:hypothetical protein